ncbi:hypothetical protein CC86DRAFT_426424 [Ophiobolus disseminans]|uniref:Transmembrane protein n=1 Tax=Ophiobolus disseminans TaxID=1469910 RepID=A0A6A6ZL82_9PLEO|nr:hypothetical protein CC86DRAFT_426424 [Ophiobolus disseminans]
MATGTFPPTHSHMSQQPPRSVADEKDAQHPDSFVDVELGADKPRAATKKPTHCFSYRPYMGILTVLAGCMLVIGVTLTLILTRQPAHSATHVSRGLIAPPFRPEVSGPRATQTTVTRPLPTPTLDPKDIDPEALEEFLHRPYVGGNARRHERHEGALGMASDGMASAGMASSGMASSATKSTVTVTTTSTTTVEPTHTPTALHSTTASSIASTAPTPSIKPLSDASSDASSSEPLKVEAQNSNDGPIASQAGLVSGIVGGVVGFIVLAVLMCMCCGGR